jgi:hypothetical protein
MTFLLMMVYGVLALAVLALMQLAMVGIVAVHRNFVARHETLAVPVTLDGPDMPASA